MLGALLELLLILYEFFLFKYSTCQHILQYRLILVLRPHGHALIPDYLLVDRVDGDYLPKLVVDGRGLDEDDPVEQVAGQFVLGEELREFFPCEEGLGLLGGGPRLLSNRLSGLGGLRLRVTEDLV